MSSSKYGKFLTELCVKLLIYPLKDTLRSEFADKFINFFYFHEMPKVTI